MKITLCLILKLSKIKINNVIPKKALIVFDLSPVKIIDPKNKNQQKSQNI